MIPKLLTSLIFAGAAVQKFTGNVAPGLVLLGSAGLGLALLGALATLIGDREAAVHITITVLTLLLVVGQLSRSTVA